MNGIHDLKGIMFVQSPWLWYKYLFFALLKDIIKVSIEQTTIGIIFISSS